jgi:hypothetical protein
MIAVLVVLGLAALGGGTEMLLFPHGGTYLPPERLEKIPLLDSYVVPGLVLGAVFGIGSLVTAAGMFRRWSWRVLGAVERATGRHWSWAATVIIGIGFAAWLTVELILLGGPWASGLDSDRTTAYATYGAFGSMALALLLLPHLRSVRCYLALDC